MVVLPPALSNSRPHYSERHESHFLFPPLTAHSHQLLCIWSS